MGACPESDLPRCITPAIAKVLEELARDGAANDVLGKRMWVSPQTIKFHLSAAMRISGTSNRTALTLWWIRRGRYEWMAANAEEEQDEAV